MGDKVNKNVQQYIELIYSEKSALNVIQDLEERKREACKRAKLDFESAEVQDIIHMRDKKVNEIAVDYLIQQNGNDFGLLLADQHLLWYLQKRIMEPPSEGAEEMVELDKKTKMSVQADELLERVKKRLLVCFKSNALIEIAVNKVKMTRYEDRLKTKSKNVSTNK